MHPIISEQLARTHRAELVHQAATRRRVALARSRGGRRTPGPLRHALGLRIVAVGVWLAGTR